MAITKLIAASLANDATNLVKLTSDTDVSGASSFSIDGFFSSDYDIYDLHLYDIHLDGSASNQLRCRVRVSNADVTTASYEHSGYYAQRGSTNSLTHAGGTAQTQFGFSGWNRPNDDTGNRTLSGLVRIFNPLTTSFNKNLMFEFQAKHEDNTYFLTEQFGGTVITNSALSGITFYTSHSANFDAGQYILYGVK